MLKINKTNQQYEIAFQESIRRFNRLISDDVKDILCKFIRHPGSELILDLDGITFIDTVGFAALLSVLNTANENNCRFRFKNVSPEVQELIELLDLGSVFITCEN